MKYLSDHCEHWLRIGGEGQVLFMYDCRAPALRRDYTDSEKWTSRQKLNINEQLFKENWFPVGFLFLLMWLLLGCPGLPRPGGELLPLLPTSLWSTGYQARGDLAGKYFICMWVFKKVAILSDGNVCGCFSWS